MPPLCESALLRPPCVLSSLLRSRPRSCDRSSDTGVTKNNSPGFGETSSVSSDHGCRRSVGDAVPSPGSTCLTVHRCQRVDGKTPSRHSGCDQTPDYPPSEPEKVPSSFSCQGWTIQLKGKVFLSKRLLLAIHRKWPLLS